MILQLSYIKREMADIKVGARLRQRAIALCRIQLTCILAKEIAVDVMSFVGTP